MYLSKIIHDLGLRLKSSAVCPQVRRIRHGHFTVESALLRKDWKLESILDNIKLCEEYTKPDKLVSDFNIEQSSDDVKLLPQSISSKISQKSLAEKCDLESHTLQKVNNLS